jgi:hypothetical protein
MLLYERIEERGIDYVLRKYSQYQRDYFLENTPEDDLVMYAVIGLTPEELDLLFSRRVLQKEFSRLLPENLFYSWSTIKGVVRVSSIFRRLDAETLMTEYKKCPSTLFYLLDAKQITVRDILGKLQNTTLHEISRLRRYHIRFQEVWGMLCKLLVPSVFPVREGSTWSGKIVKGLKEAAQRAYSRDLAKYIVDFI